MSKTKTKRGPYNKTVWAEPKEHLSVWPTKNKSAQWKTLAKAKKRPVSAMIVDAMDAYPAVLDLIHACKIAYAILFKQQEHSSDVATILKAIQKAEQQP